MVEHSYPHHGHAYPSDHALATFRLESSEEVWQKHSEHDLAVKMKKKFDLVKNPCKYSIISMNDPAVQISTQILAGKVMRQFCMDEVLAPLMSLVAQCVEGVEFN